MNRPIIRALVRALLLELASLVWMLFSINVLGMGMTPYGILQLICYCFFAIVNLPYIVIGALVASQCDIGVMVVGFSASALMWVGIFYYVDRWRTRLLTI